MKTILKLFFIVLCLGFSSVNFAEVLVPAKLEDQSPKEAVRKKLFPAGTPDRACKIASKDPAGIVDADPSLTATIQNIIKGVSQADHKILLPLFHPLIKVKTKQVRGALISMERISGKKLDPTLFRAYALNSLDGQTGEIECPEDGVKLHPVYGHPLQVGVWIQISGDLEITRLFVVLVPTTDKWLIGSWHVQQWTHAGKDFTAWRTEAQNLAKNKDDVASWVYYDLTAKLLDGGKYIVFPVAEDIVKERQKLMNGKSLQETLSSELTGEKLVYASSLFSRKGAAILLRFGIPGEWSATAIKDHCRAKLKQFGALSWMKAIAGLRCEYVMPTESIEKEGALGAIFVE